MDLKTHGAHGFSSGAKKYPAIQCAGYAGMIQVFYSGAGTVVLELETSTDGAHFDPYPNSAQALNMSAESHTWQLPELIPEMFVRLAVYPDGATGEITKVNYLI